MTGYEIGANIIAMLEIEDTLEAIEDLLRIDEYRVFYDVSDQIRIVKIELIGYKEGNKLYVQGEEYEL